MFRFRRSVYLDNNATTPVSREVQKMMIRVLKNNYGNPSSLYRVARDSASILEESRENVAECIGAGAHEVIFTGSATEANNTILTGLADHFYPGKKKIIASPIEHDSVMMTLEHLKKRGIEVLYCPVDNHGRIDIRAIEACIDDNTFLITCMMANNEIGTVQDINALSRIARRRDILLMSDCVQALGKIRVHVRESGLDYASFSAHKINGPKGVGAVYVREGCPIFPIIHGGHQESGLRAGTESIHNIAGFGKACQEVRNNLELADDIGKVKNYFAMGLKRINPGILLQSPDSDSLPNTLSVTFPGVSNSLLMAFLDSHGIACSAGSACNTQADSPSHVLKAIGLTDDSARQTIRFSLSKKTGKKDIDYVLESIKDFLDMGSSPVNIVLPGHVDENFLRNEDLFILDVRFWHDRKSLRGLSGSHEASFFSIKGYLPDLPKDKYVLAVCQMGYNAPIIAYLLRSNHFKRVGFLATGLLGLKMVNPELYEKYSGRDIIKLTPRS